MTYEEVAKLKKMLCRNDRVEQSIFKNPDGTYYTPEETARIMIDTHFPNAAEEPPDHDREGSSLGARWTSITPELAGLMHTVSVSILSRSVLIRGRARTPFAPLCSNGSGPECCTD